MEKAVLELESGAILKIKAVGGDLRISGREGHSFEAQASKDGNLKVEARGGEVHLSCKSSCLVFLPEHTHIEAESVGGDARLTDIAGQVLVRNVGGDLILRRGSSATFELVGGDMRAKGVEGDLSVDVLGGDAYIQDVEGSVHLRSVGGDLILNRVRGRMECSAGGDLSAMIEPETSGPVHLSAGGDLACLIQDDVSASIQLQAGGDVLLPEGEYQSKRGEPHGLTLGTGEVNVDLKAGGDLSVRHASEGVDSPEQFVGELLNEVDFKLAEMEARISALGAGITELDADRISERVRRAVRRAQSKSMHASKKAMKAREKIGRLNIPSDGWLGGEIKSPAETQEVTDEERLAILKMVEAGKISVEEAESLFKAIEGEI